MKRRAITVAEGVPRMTVAERIHGHLHPLLAGLQKSPSGEREFWVKIADVRTPLIERDAPNHSIVTFVFPMPEGAQHVVVLPGFNQYSDPAHLMDHIAGTNVLHAS